MQYGFVIDHDRCIGCHACTVACKAENDVPVGSFRTSVKYVETGAFPDVRRHFLVQRCNHCTDAPCVTICPVKALHKRDDGIVDLDRDACIGCKACMQACPYDAIYLNPDTNSAEKCHFCAHRVEQGLAPACVNVCPTQAIIPGDFDDAQSVVNLHILGKETAVRRPEQGTGPNVRYVGANDIALQPGRAERPPMYLWSDRPPEKPDAWPAELPLEEAARVVLDTGHPIRWGWQVAAYLVTKGIAAGAAMLAPFVGLFGIEGAGATWAPELFGFIFCALTCLLLVEDLAKPMRFYRLLTRPNFSSWLVRGGVVLTAFMVVTTAILAAQWFGETELVTTLRWINLPIGAAVAGYTAFLFAQCKGRDLWESPWLLPHLLFQAVFCGAAVLLPFAPRSAALLLVGAVGLIGHLALALLEWKGAHPTDNAKQAAAFLGTVKLGPFTALRLAIVIGVVVPLALIAPIGGYAFLPALAGLYAYEHAFVRAGQLPPLS